MDNIILNIQKVITIKITFCFCETEHRDQLDFFVRFFSSFFYYYFCICFCCWFALVWCNKIILSQYERTRDEYESTMHLKCKQNLMFFFSFFFFSHFTRFDHYFLFFFRCFCVFNYINLIRHPENVIQIFKIKQIVHFVWPEDLFSYFSSIYLTGFFQLNIAYFLFRFFSRLVKCECECGMYSPLVKGRPKQEEKRRIFATMRGTHCSGFIFSFDFGNKQIIKIDFSKNRFILFHLSIASSVFFFFIRSSDWHFCGMKTRKKRKRKKAKEKKNRISICWFFINSFASLQMIQNLSKGKV